jgi:hypothetical protein
MLSTSCATADDDLATLAGSSGAAKLAPSRINATAERELADRYNIHATSDDALTQFSPVTNLVYTLEELQPTFTTRFPRSSFSFVGSTTTGTAGPPSKHPAHVRLLAAVRAAAAEGR